MELFFVVIISFADADLLCVSTPRFSAVLSACQAFGYFGASAKKRSSPRWSNFGYLLLATELQVTCKR